MKVMRDAMRTEAFVFTGCKGIILPAMLWLPDDEPKAILQITHGMTEHIGRYESFAQKILPSRKQIDELPCYWRTGA